MRTIILRTALARAETELNFSRKKGYLTQSGRNAWRKGSPEAFSIKFFVHAHSLILVTNWIWEKVLFYPEREGTTRQQNCFSISSFHFRPTASTGQGRPRRFILHSLIQQLGMGQWESKPTFEAGRTAEAANRMAVLTYTWILEPGVGDPVAQRRSTTIYLYSRLTNRTTPLALAAGERIRRRIDRFGSEFGF